MNPKVLTTLLACGLTAALPSFANKGATYVSPASGSADNLDWTKNWYLGAGVNADTAFTQLVNGDIDQLQGLSGDEIELNNSNIGFDVYLGREISPHWAAEFGYTYVGNVTLESETGEVEEQNATIKQWNVHVVGLGRFPIGKYFNFMLKGGPAWYFNSEKFHTLDTDDVTHAKYRGWALEYGAGVEVAWDVFLIRADYTAISPVTQILDDFYVTDLVGISLIYRFTEGEG